MFPGFAAFTLPPPSCNSEDSRNISKNRSRINPFFWSGVERFKGLIKATLAPKQSVNDGEFVTGKGKLTFTALLSKLYAFSLVYRQLLKLALSGVIDFLLMGYPLFVKYFCLCMIGQKSSRDVIFLNYYKPGKY